MTAEILDAVEYRNGQKNNWRRTVWNHVARLCGTSRGICLYLPGSRDLDRQVAVGTHGFRHADLIAVERCPKVAATLRANGTTTINLSLLQVLRHWPANTPVTCVLADLQSGLTDEAASIAEAYVWNPAFTECVLAVNLLRGRELSMDFVKRPEKSGQLAAELQVQFGFDLNEYRKFSDEPLHQSKHRGVAFARLVMLLMGSAGVFDQHIKWFGDPINRGKIHEFYRRSMPLRAIPIRPYRSSNSSQTMDAVVMKAAFCTPRPALVPTLPQISAALALRTRRLRGELPRARP